MATELLTTAKLKAIDDKQIGTILTDGGGLRGRVRRTRSGELTVQFEYKYRVGYKHRTAKVDQWPRRSLAEIRAIYRSMKTDLNSGVDPIEKRKATKLETQLETAREAEQQRLEIERLTAEAAAQRSFASAIAQWQKHELSRRKDSGEEAMRAINKDVIPSLGEVALIDVRRAMLLSIFDIVVDRGSLVMANHLFSDLRQFFNFAVAREWIEAHPLAGLKKENIGGRQKERERYLSEDEVVDLRDSLPTANLQRTTELAIWIMLSTCCRVGELIQAKWEAIDLEKGQWVIPAGNSKNAKEHTVHLSDFAIEQFLQLQSLTGAYEWCMPTRDGTSHIGLKSITKQIKDRVRDEPLAKRSKATGVLLLSGGPWTPHDLRRTGATMMGDLGVMGEVIDRCLNHIEVNKLRRTYQRHELRSEQREAWRLLGERLHLLLSNPADNVVVTNFTM